MKLVPWRKKRRSRDVNESTHAPLMHLRSEVERLFERFFGEPLGASEDWNGFAGGVLAPPLDVAENDREITLRAELPGVDPKDLDISITGNVLTLSGRKSAQSEQRGENYYHSERRFGAFRRSVPLPTSVDPDRVDAEYARGVLTIRLHKTAEKPVRRIPVSTPKS